MAILVTVSVAILVTCGIFFASVLIMVRLIEASFLSNRDRIDRDFFTDLQNQLAEFADRGRAYALFLGITCVLIMFPLEYFLAGDGRGMPALLLMWLKMIPLFVVWHLICRRQAMKFSQESFAQAEKLTGLSKVRGRVIKRKVFQRTLFWIIVQVGQETFRFYPSAELLEKNVWGRDLAKGSKVVVYYQEVELTGPIATHIIVIDPILEEPEHWQDLMFPIRGDWGD